MEPVSPIPDSSDNTDPPPAEPVEEAKPVEPFSGLLAAIDVAQEVTGVIPPGITLGDIPAGEAANWRIKLEDYASPLGDARFEVGQAESDDGKVRWTLFSKPLSADDADWQDRLLDCLNA